MLDAFQTSLRPTPPAGDRPVAQGLGSAFGLAALWRLEFLLDAIDAPARR